MTSPLRPRFLSTLCRANRRIAPVLLCVLGASTLLACDKEDKVEVGAEQRDPRTGLTAMEAREILVRVGDRDITLGQYAETLLRMDPYQRLRYQTEERQKELLDDMIQTELLAQEARRRGLDKDPEVQLRIKQALRDEVLAELERKVPGPETFSEREVREYYEAHRSEFQEPLRHRLSVIEVKSEALAQTIISELKQAQASDEKNAGQVWAQLAAKHSENRQLLGKDEAPELAGDLGFVSAPGVERGANPAIAPAIRSAGFSVQKVGDIVAEPVQAAGKFYVVRISGISAARDRSVSDAERSIRVELRRLKMLEVERAFEAELRKKYPVVIAAGAEASSEQASTDEKGSP